MIRCTPNDQQLALDLHPDGGDGAELPREHVDAQGRRFCRHHPDEQIPREAHPCARCWAAARGTFGPLVNTSSAEVA